MQEKTNNPFGNVTATQTPIGGALAQSDQQRQVAEVQAAMMVARMNPRNQMQAMDRIINACSRQTLAESAVYSYARGGSDVTGPSIRLAEAIAQQWGNIQFGMREISQSRGESTVQAYAWDVETNTRKEVVFQVPHIRYTRKGSKKLEDPRDIYEMIANNGARRLRACILSVVPGDVVESAVRQCELTMRANADTSPDAVKKMVEAFEGFGVSKKQVEKRIQRRLDAIQPAQIISLRKIYLSLKDGMSDVSDWFEPEESEGPNLNEMAKGTKAIKNKPVDADGQLNSALLNGKLPRSKINEFKSYYILDTAEKIGNVLNDPAGLEGMILEFMALGEMDANDDIPEIDIGEQ